MTTLIPFPLQKQQQQRRTHLCYSCSAYVSTDSGVEIEVPSKQQSDIVEVLCQECYDATPAWVWAAE